MTSTVSGLPGMLAMARTGGYAVPAFNVVDVVTMDGVLRAAVDRASPVIVQTSAATARTWGPTVLASAFRALRTESGAAAILQLDHCDQLALIDACLDAGWDAVLFDGAGLDPVVNLRETSAVVARAHAIGAAVEAELESIGGLEPGASAPARSALSLDANLRFVEESGIDCFAPSIGNVHGRSSAPVILDIDRVRQLAASTSVPLALHGGTGIADATMLEVIAAGCSKVNVSTAIREACAAALVAGTPPTAGRIDPLTSLVAMRDAATAVAAEVMVKLGSVGRAGPGKA